MAAFVLDQDLLAILCVAGKMGRVFHVPLVPARHVSWISKRTVVRRGGRGRVMGYHIGEIVRVSGGS